MQQTSGMPAHIAIIMDGNGRWAKQRGLARSMGHREGAKTVEIITRHCLEIGIGHLTLFAFSTENWSRPKAEVEAIMNLLRDYLTQCEQQQNREVRTRFIGDRAPLAPDLVRRMDALEAATANNTRMNLNIAINYGGRDEILHAARRLACLVAEGKLDPRDIDAALFSQGLYTAGQPDPDMIIRPSGEQRLSNFLLWQCAYAELIYMDKLWPDFTPADLDTAIALYAGRDRRYGGISG
jgi:undecaprenyl diphosphate synthase